MKRRQAIMLLGGAAAAWPLAAWAQQPAEKLPRIGSIQNFQNENFEAFIQGLREAGYVDGQNMLLETRFYAGVLDRIDEFTNELVSLKCNVILATAPYAVQAVIATVGTASLRSSICLPPSSGISRKNPVRLPPGRARLLTHPFATGSLSRSMPTIGILLVAFALISAARN